MALSFESPRLAQASTFPYGVPTFLDAANCAAAVQPTPRHIKGPPHSTNKIETRPAVVWDRPNKPAIARQTHVASCCGTNKPSSGDGRNRTDNLLYAKQVLYQLSYIP